MKKNIYSNNLTLAVINASNSKNWNEARLEWKIVPYKGEDDLSTDTCICGHEDLINIYYIKNINTSKVLTVGSRCIKKFENTNLNKELELQIQENKLREKIISNQFIKLTSDFFSKKLLSYLIKIGIIDKNDEEFIMKMFNKRDKSKITEKQIKKITYIIMIIRNHYLNISKA